MHLLQKEKDEDESKEKEDEKDEGTVYHRYILFCCILTF